MRLIKNIKRAALPAAIFVSACILMGLKDQSVLSATPFTGNNEKAVVVLELFTSQGCSSCPPADALLAEYAKANNPQIIPISFHVDYWNRLGWTDPFSDQVYSMRQRWYSQHLPNGSVYTPQLIVNGRTETVGNNRMAVTQIVKKETENNSVSKIAVGNIAIGKKEISFHYTTVNAGKDVLLNVALVQKEVTTQIKAGENKGLSITNRNIVRAFKTQSIKEEGEGKIDIPLNFKAADYALVLYAQNPTSLAVSTAVMSNLLQ